MRIHVSSVVRAAACLAVASCCHTASAIDFGDSFQLHGFGSQDYLQANHNTYLGADNRGTWDDNFLGLVGSFRLNEKSILWAQLETSSMDETKFTWFFIDYQFTDTLRGHAGRVKMPLGIYNEYIDTKFLQMSSLEPALYQGASDFVADAYNGIGLDYTQSLGSAGEILWQVYGGNTYDPDPPEGTHDRRAFGGRITYTTPVDGLRLLVSAIRIQNEQLATRQLVNETHAIYSIDYVHGDWDVKSEFGTHALDQEDSHGFYIQVGRTFGKWTPFARYDDIVMDTELSKFDSFYQKTVVVGLNYKLASNISLRVEDHFNRGYALPVSSGEVPEGMGTRNWQLFAAVVHFMF
jgi:hypothetical protein